jgi:hypothetical protein
MLVRLMAQSILRLSLVERGWGCSEGMVSLADASGELKADEPDAWSARENERQSLTLPAR